MVSHINSKEELEKMKKMIFKLTALTLSGVLLSACVNNGKDEVVQITQMGSIVSTDTSALTNTSVLTNTQTSIQFSEEDEYRAWENQTYVKVELKGTNIVAEGSGVVVKDSKLTIQEPGIYVISGQLSDGQIVVDVAKDGLVQIVLNGVEIYHSNSSPIYVVSADKVMLSLAEGTVNKVSDGAEYLFESTDIDEPNATIFSKDDLVINGTGTLIVEANYNNGITSKDNLIITGGNIQIQATDDGLMGKDSVQIKEADIEIVARGDGIKATNDTDSEKGYINIQSGNFMISTGGGSAKAQVKTNQQAPRGGGRFQAEMPVQVQTLETSTTSTKGIKATTSINISGGTFVIDSLDDAVHSNNKIIIENGKFEIASGDDGIHADTLIEIYGGTINITKSYEGIESNLINIINGDIQIVASDDGINLSEKDSLKISGGHIAIDAGGDGLDSNGSIEMTGGTVIVNGPTNDGNGALDYDGSFNISGGVLVAAGSAGMAQAPGGTSTQYSIMMTYATNQEAGTTIHLQDTEGDSLFAFEPSKAFRSILISIPQLVQGEYTLVTGGQAEGITFTLENTVTWLNESGVTTAQANQPGMGRRTMNTR